MIGLLDPRLDRDRHIEVGSLTRDLMEVGVGLYAANEGLTQWVNQEMPHQYINISLNL